MSGWVKEEAMKQLPKEKYQVAWFKLSEFVKRGEKERALGIYKLLMHSIEDRAFSKQLEGDLLLFFDEPSAIDSYVDAANCYKKNGKLAQATAIYEHLVLLSPDNTEFIMHLAKLYSTLNHSTRIVLSTQRLIEPIIQAHNITTLQKALEYIIPILNKEEQATLYQTTLFAMLKYDPDNAEIIIPIIQKILKTLRKSKGQLKNFINKIGTIDKDYQQEAIQMSKKILS